MKLKAITRFTLFLSLAYCGPSPGLAQTLRLSLTEAIQMALGPDGSLRVEAGFSDIDAARARVDLSKSALLPHVGAAVSQRRLTLNLEALGLGDIGGPFRPPKPVGPFSSWDARAEVQQTLFNWSAFKTHEASKASLEATELDLERVREQVAREVALRYLEALRAQANVEGARSDVELADSLLETARRRLAAGTGVRIEETRAAVQLSNQQQRLLVARHQSARANLHLQRTIGSEIGEQIELTDLLADEATPLMTAEAAWALAQSSRSDVQALEARLISAEKRFEAARGQRIPSVSGFADYGSSGIYPSDSIPTWAVGVQVQIPIFEGGRLRAVKAEGQAGVRRLRAQLADQLEQIKLEVRLSLTAARLAREQVVVARQGLDLAGEELNRARRRYEGGVTSSLEVTQAQSSLERARVTLNSTLFENSAARVELEVAAGTILANSGVTPLPKSTKR